ncbi:uncharacterized protein LOC111337483 [Stylophora pistillata]|uniref:uncharacterized protein LOC111337483 n=1 Tax=Stylophora pistillata TaxID=50429 RepID=UPI000C04F85A|nr:uncharacterized protein LOC111337483 [Stylophora pistillata]
MKSEVSVCSELDSNDCLLRNLDVGNQTFICTADLDFEGGIKYVTKIKAVNLVGVSTEVFSDGFVLDSTPPLMGEVFFAETSKSTIEGVTKYYARSLISAQWRGFWDKESDVHTSYVCLGTTSGECNTRNFTMVQNSTAYTFADLPFLQGETYFVSVKVENGAGLNSDIQTSEGILFDQTGPTNEGTVMDGNTEGEDVNVQQSRILIAAHWNAFDDLESDVVKLTWCAGLSPGLCDLVKETELNNNNTSIRYFLSKPILNGYRYFVTVKATNGAGVTSLLKSDGVMVDDTPPISGSVIDGLESDRNYVNGEDDISASWFAFMDLESGIDSYKVALCHERNLSNCPQPFTSTGKTTNVTISGLDLERGVQYVFIVRAINFAGLAKEAFSDGFTVDFNPPKKGEIWIGVGNEQITYQADPTKIVVRWSNFMDVESGIKKYEVCVSSILQNCSVTSFVDAGLNTSFIVDGLNLKHGGKYYAIVRGTNAIGLSTEGTSGGVLIDLTPPLQKDDGNVSPPSSGNRAKLNASLLQVDVSNSSTANGPSITFKCLEEYLTSSWEEFEDRESGMVNYDWCVGTAKSLCDVVSMRSVGMKTRGAAIVNRLQSGTMLFSTVFAINGAKMRRQIISRPCTVIAVAPKFTEVIDISSFSSSNLTDTDWKATMQSLSFRWKAIGSYLDEISLLRVKIAVTEFSSNLSVPRLLQEKSWNSESLELSFMDVLSAQHNVTIRSMTLKPWMRYRGIVRVWNEGGIFSEASSDGVRMEPSPPATRGLAIRDKAAENEHLRWWPNLRIPPVNDSIVDSDITFISSPAKLELTVSSATSNSTANTTNFILDHDLFSPTADFKIVVKRVTSGVNDTNSTTDSRTMKIIPGFADLEGPCCAKHPTNTMDALSDTHFKPTSPANEFGVSLAILADDVLAVGSNGKVLLQSLKNKTGRNLVTLSDHSDSNVTVKVSSYHNTTGFLLNGKLYLYKRTSDDLHGVLGKSMIIGHCKNVPSSNCPEIEEWADYLGQSFALNDNVVAVRGTRLSTHSNVVAVFRNMSGKWMFAQTVGEKRKHINFGHSISLNENFMAIAAGDGNNCCAMIYSLATLTLRKTICLTDPTTIVAPLSLYLTKTDALVILSKTARLLKVFQLNMTSSSHYEVCRYRAGSLIDELSGNLDVNTREEGFMIALGFEAMRGGEGVQLLGFQGIYTASKNSTSSNESSKCLNLGSVLARESGLRADSYGTRTSVLFKGNTILFGIPGVLTWPKNDQWLSTGRVYMATYCPVNHFRSTISELHSLRSVTCLPCEPGRKSFGGFSDACSVCDEKLCLSPPDNESSSFTTDICDDTSCLSTIYLSNKTNGIDAHMRHGSLFVSGPEHVYSVELLETTRAGESTSSFSDSFVIDATAPVPGRVYDGLGTDQNMNCSENSTFGEHSQCSTRNFEDTDIEFTNNTREIHARWIDFLDNESDIVEYFWCVGTRPMADDIRMCESTGLRPNGSHFGLGLSHGDSYYVTIVACNGARMCSAGHSDGVTIDTTPPLMTYVRDGIMGPDMDYQVFVDIIFAYFAARDEESGVNSYEVAWGTAAGLTDITDFEELINATIWRAKFKDDALEIGRKYYATVRATNGAGLLSDELSSNGIVVGKSEYVFDNSSKASFFFDTVSVNDDGSRKDGGVGKTYGTLSVPEGAVEEEVKLRCYSLDEKTLEGNKSEEGPVSDPKRTAPKQFMLGNYSFQIKALDPINNTVQEGYRFAKPIKLAMFYDVDNLVKANKKHVNNELTEKDIDPVLFLWDPKNETWFDAKLTCPEPWSIVNRSVKLLEVNVCHLTQFAFFFSFQAEHGLLLFWKNHSSYSLDGGIHVSRTMKVTTLEILVRRSKGSLGDITV